MTVVARPILALTFVVPLYQGSGIWASSEPRGCWDAGAVPTAWLQASGLATNGFTARKPQCSLPCRQSIDGLERTQPQGSPGQCNPTSSSRDGLSLSLRIIPWFGNKWHPRRCHDVHSLPEPARLEPAWIIACLFFGPQLATMAAIDLVSDGILPTTADCSPFRFLYLRELSRLLRSAQRKRSTRQQSSPPLIFLRSIKTLGENKVLSHTLVHVQTNALHTFLTCIGFFFDHPPPVLDKPKCHTANYDAEAGLIWPNRETKPVTSSQTAAQDNGPPPPIISCAAAMPQRGDRSEKGGRARSLPNLMHTYLHAYVRSSSRLTKHSTQLSYLNSHRLAGLTSMSSISCVR